VTSSWFFIRQKSVHINGITCNEFCPTKVCCTKYKPLPNIDINYYTNNEVNNFEVLLTVHLSIFRVLVTTVAVEEKYVLHILSLCL